MIVVANGLAIDPRELEFRFVRSSGPGGQNVNKVATAVILRFDASRSAALTPEVRARLLAVAGRRATPAGVIVIRAERFRTQSQNREDAIRRLVSLVRAALHGPRPRVPTRPPRRAATVRLDAKRRRGDTKSSRRRIVSGVE